MRSKNMDSNIVRNYEEFKKRQSHLQLMYQQQLQKIWEKKSSNLENLQTLLNIAREIQNMNRALNTSIRYCSDSAKNYTLIEIMRILLERRTEQPWDIDYLIKQDFQEKETVFIILNKEGIWNDYSYEYLDLQAKNGNLQEDFLIYDKLTPSIPFDFANYLLHGIPQIWKYFNPNFQFSPHYPFIQQYIQTIVMKNYQDYYQKNMTKKKSNL